MLLPKPVVFEMVALEYNLEFQCWSRRNQLPPTSIQTKTQRKKYSSQITLVPSLTWNLGLSTCRHRSQADAVEETEH